MSFCWKPQRQVFSQHGLVYLVVCHPVWYNGCADPEIPSGGLVFCFYLSTYSTEGRTDPPQESFGPSGYCCFLMGTPANVCKASYIANCDFSGESGPPELPSLWICTYNESWRVSLLHISMGHRCVCFLKYVLKSLKVILSKWTVQPVIKRHNLLFFQVIRFGRVCSYVNDFNNRNLFLTAKLLKQGYRYHKIRKAFSKFYHRHSELIVKYNIG